MRPPRRNRRSGGDGRRRRRRIGIGGGGRRRRREGQVARGDFASSGAARRRIVGVRRQQRRALRNLRRPLLLRSGCNGGYHFTSSAQFSNPNFAAKMMQSPKPCFTGAEITQLGVKQRGLLCRERKRNCRNEWLEREGSYDRCLHGDYMYLYIYTRLHF